MITNSNVSVYGGIIDHFWMYMQYSPLLKSSDVTLPCSIIWLADISVRISQKRIRLSKCPEIIVEPAPSDVTRSLHDDPANFVSVPENMFYCKSEHSE